MKGILNAPKTLLQLTFAIVALVLILEEFRPGTGRDINAFVDSIFQSKETK